MMLQSGFPFWRTANHKPTQGRHVMCDRRPCMMMFNGCWWWCEWRWIRTRSVSGFMAQSWYTRCCQLSGVDYYLKISQWGTSAYRQGAMPRVGFGWGLLGASIALLTVVQKVDHLLTAALAALAKWYSDRLPIVLPNYPRADRWRHRGLWVAQSMVIINDKYHHLFKFT